MSIIVLTEEQDHAVENALAALKAHNRALLVGYAGTGKTTCLRELIDRFRASVFWPEIAVTAPTNKAVKVLESKLVFSDVGKGEGLTFRTLHSFLGLKPILDERTGEQHFIPDRNAPEPKRVDLLIVDEASMLSSELLVVLLEYQEKNDIGVLLVGDGAQLPPVGELVSPALTLNWPSSSLNTVMRHAGPILEYAQRVRQLDGSLPRGSQRLPLYAQEGGLFRDPVAWALAALELFRSEAFKKSSDHVRILSWTNERVRELNHRIHEVIYGPGKSWMPEQRIVANKPVGVQGAFLMSNGEEATILKVAEDISEDGLHVYKLFVAPDASFRCTLTVLKRSGIPQYQELESTYRLKALQTEAGWKRSRAWREYYDFVGGYADVAPLYCQTVHKSQGSTYQHVFVDIRDIRKNQNRVEAVRCLYTAVTRAAEGLYTLV